MWSTWFALGVRVCTRGTGSGYSLPPGEKKNTRLFVEGKPWHWNSLQAVSFSPGRDVQQKGLSSGCSSRPFRPISATQLLEHMSPASACFPLPEHWGTESHGVVRVEVYVDESPTTTAGVIVPGCTAYEAPHSSLAGKKEKTAPIDKPEKILKAVHLV